MSTRPSKAAPPAQHLDLIIETVIYLESESRRLAREASQRLGITATQLNVLKLLDEIGELSLSELSRRLAAQNSAVTGIVDRMVQAGLVAREQSVSDRRVWRIRMTSRGADIAKRTQVLPWDLLRGALGSLDRREKEQLVAILEKVAAHVARQVAGERTEARENATLERVRERPGAPSRSERVRSEGANKNGSR